MCGFYEYVEVKWDRVKDKQAFPFSLPAIRDIKKLPLDPRCTFLIGENGTGKSTLIEAIAVELEFSAEGGSKDHRFRFHDTHSDLHESLFIKRTLDRPGDTFFLRAETLYNFASLSGAARYGSLHFRSHGEAFLDILKAFRGHGFYIMDEPESALSPQRQLAFLMRMDELIHDGSQFIIATHSPIILSYPRATIYQLDGNGIRKVEYEETEHFRLTKDFLNQREHFLRHLIG